MQVVRISPPTGLRDVGTAVDHSTSPGCTIISALWIIEVSQGRTRTVTAGPQSTVSSRA